MKTLVELQITGRAEAEEKIRRERVEFLPPREVAIPLSAIHYRGRHWHRYIYHYLIQDFEKWRDESLCHSMPQGWRRRDVAQMPAMRTISRLRKYPFGLSLRGVQESHLPQVKRFLLQDLFHLYGQSRTGLLYLHRGDCVSIIHDGFRDRLLLNEFGQNFAQELGLDFEVFDAP